MDALYKNIRRFRKERELSQDQLAKMLNYKSKTSIIQIEKGKADLSITKAKEFAKVFGIPLGMLLGLDRPEGNCDNNQLQTLVDKLKANGFDSLVFSSGTEASEYIIRKCEGKKVGFGDDTACRQLNLVDKLNEIIPNEHFYNVETRKSRAMAKKAITADILIIGAGGISYETGEIVNISNSGIRASLLFPDEVIFIVGTNRIFPNLSDTIHSVRNISRPRIAEAFNAKTPCVMHGKCMDCNSPDRVCRVTNIYHKKPQLLGEVTVLLIDEALGL